MFPRPPVRRIDKGVEVRISRQNSDLPRQCIVCLKDGVAQDGALIRYRPTATPPKDLRNFSMRFPLCKEHSLLFNRGLKIGKISMWMLGGSFLPFVVGLVLFGVFLDYYISLPLFAAGLVCGGMGYALLSPSNKLLKENGRGAIIMRLVTPTDITLEIMNKELAEVYKTRGQGKKSRS